MLARREQLLKKSTSLTITLESDQANSESILPPSAYEVTRKAE